MSQIIVKGAWPGAWRDHFFDHPTFLNFFELLVVGQILGCEWEKYEPSIGTKIFKKVALGKSGGQTSDLDENLWQSTVDKSKIWSVEFITLHEYFQHKIY